MKTNFWRSVAARRRKIVLWVLGIILVYAIIGFLILPPIIRAAAVKSLAKDLNRKVSIQKVNVNPFVPSLTIRGLLVLDKDGKPFISWDKVYFNLEISSIFRKAWTFREITVMDPSFRAQMFKDYTYNFSDLVKTYSTSSTNGPAQKASKPLLVRVKRLTVTDARLRVSDYTVQTPFKRIIGPFYLTASNVCTVPDSVGSGMLFGKSDAGEYYYWRGDFCMTPLHSKGNAAIFDVTMNKFKPLYQDIFSFDIRSGQSGFCANYSFEWGPSKHVAAITNMAFGISNLRVGHDGNTNDIIDIHHFAETDVHGELPTHHGEIGHMKFDGVTVFLERGTNKAVNLLEITTPKVSKPSPPGGIVFMLNAMTNVIAMLIHTTNEWTGIIHEINFTNCGAHLVDLAYTRPATLDLSRINIDVKNISNYPNTNVTAGISLDWNKYGTINVGLTTRLSPLTGDVRLDLDKLDLSTLAAYGESEFNVLIPSADLSLDGDVHVYTPHKKLPEITFKGDTWLDRFHAMDGMGDDLLKWDEIRVSGIDAKLNPTAASISRISVNNLSAQAIIETNRTINLIDSLHPPGSNAVAQVKARTTAKTSTSATNAIPPISIATVAITNAQIAFADRSVTPNVTMTLQHAGGTITGISSTELQHGRVNLHALVDGVSPAIIAGRINPFSGTLTNQLNIFMTNMDMLPTSPYSGEFAGYRIASGALSLDLRYTVVGRQLQSKNVITLNQFTFGDQVPSTNATKLPVRLAIAILKDRQGRIVLDVPVEGNLNDPSFRIGRVVRRALLNILTKVATSPFSLIGAAFGGRGSGEELRYEDFSPGSTDLTEATIRKLDVVAKALNDRPGLQLQISGSVDPVDDHKALQQIAFDREIHIRKWNSLRKSERELIAPNAVAVTPKDRAHLVKKLYNEGLDNGTITPAIIAANTNLTAIATQIQTQQAQPRETGTVKQSQYMTTRSTGPAPTQTPTPQSAPPPSSSQSKVPTPSDPHEALLEAIIPISQTDLETLALNRARAVRNYLITTRHIAASRLFLSGGTFRQDGSRAYLTLQ